MDDKINGKKRTLENDPQYFGGYLNMARHNVYLINNHIAKKIETKTNRINKLHEEANIKTCFFIDDNFKKVNHVFSYLTRFISLF